MDTQEDGAVALTHDQQRQRVAAAEDHAASGRAARLRIDTAEPAQYRLLQRLARETQHLALALVVVQEDAEGGARGTPQLAYFGGPRWQLEDDGADGRTDAAVQPGEQWLCRAVVQHALVPSTSPRLRLRLKLQWKPLDGLRSATRWSLALQALAARRMALQQLSSVISTLGGAHSQLGDTNRAHARQAQLRAQQLEMLARRLGDASLACRCRAYRALALIQQGYLTRANNVLKSCREVALELRDDKDAAVVDAVQLRLEHAIQQQQQPQDADPPQ